MYQVKEEAEEPGWLALWFSGPQTIQQTNLVPSYMTNGRSEFLEIQHNIIS
jgi:hypothetical protein